MTDPRSRARAAARKGEPFPIEAFDALEPECVCRWPEPGPMYRDHRCVACGDPIPRLAISEWIRRRLLGRAPR